LVADRTIKVIRHARRRRQANERLVAAAARAEEQDRQRRAAENASGALTSLMPTIHDLGPRSVD
jgi:hypothetical protein